MVLQAFAPGIRAELPFLMPTVAGTVRQGALTTFVYSHLAGSTKSVEELSSGSDVLANEIGSALGAIHDLPHSLVRNADLPSYTPNEFRQRRLNELDQAATTGKIPAVLLRRWEHALEDVSLWRFNPCVVHGDLHEDNLLVDGQRVTAVTGWTDLRIGDPADDMAWLVASNEQSFVDAVLRHYTEARRDSPDSHLLRRAALSAEFALAQYLVKAVATGDGNMITEAEDMLSALADDIVQHGGQPISIEPLPQAAGAPSATAGIGAVQEAPGSSPSLFIGGPIPQGVPAVHVAPIPTEDVLVSVQETSRQTEHGEEPEGEGPTDRDGLNNGEGHNDGAGHNSGEGHNHGAGHNSGEGHNHGAGHNSDAGHNDVATLKTGDAPNSSDAAGSGPARNLGESHDDTSTAALQIIDQKTS
jgi:aminoglycoside phosphotransferase